MKRFVLGILVLVLSAAQLPEKSNHYTIMCLGDSLTQGGDTFTSYHYPLWKMLNEAGYDFEFVGPNTRTYDDIGTIRHCGFGGRTAEFIAENIRTFYGDNPADIVLLHSGHNHFIEEKPVPGIIEAYKTIISEIEKINPDVKILVAQVIEVGKLPKYSYIPDLNKAIVKMVKSLDDSHLTLVDVKRNYDWRTGSVADKVHTTYQGAEIIAREWFAALQPIMGAPVHSNKDFNLTHATWTESDFNNPPRDARMQCFFHWQSGHVSKEGLTKDLEALKEAGFGGLTLFNVAEGMCDGPIGYMTPEWWDMYRYMQRECKRLDLEMGIVQGAGWGVSGGPWVTPDLAMQEVVWTEKIVTGRKKLELQLEIPVPALGIERDMQKDPERNKRYFVDREKVRGYYRDLAVFAFPTPAGELAGEPYHIKDWWGKVGLQTYKLTEYVPDRREAPAGDVVKMEDIIDITEFMDADGVLRWKAPKGNWTILRVGYQPIGVQNHPAPPDGRGLEIDKMNAKAVEFYWNHSITKDVSNPESNISLVEIDSYEAGHQNWTKGFENEFKKEMGYDIRKYLPAITGRVLDSTEATEKFLWDYRLVISHMINNNFYGTMSRKCHENGVKFSVEPYGSMGNTSEFTIAHNADVYVGEFWARRATEVSSNKLASSLAHLGGKSVVGSEAFTTSGRDVFAVYPRELKTQGDYFFCQGVNQLWLHSYVHDPYGLKPGFTLGYYGPLFNKQNTWWAMARPWSDYIARCQYMLQQGTPMIDVLYFMGEDAPARPKTREKLRPEVPIGYDYDFCATELLDSIVVKDHRLVMPSGMSYSVMVVKDLEFMRPVIAEKIEALIAKGARVYMTKKNSGSLKDFLLENGILPDFEIENLTLREKTMYPGNGIEYIHRKGETSDVYFVSNQQENNEAVFDAIFNVKDYIPEFWDASEGKVSTVTDYEKTPDGRIRVKMNLERAGSVFVVFRRPFEVPSTTVPTTKSTSMIDISGDWTMTLVDEQMSGKTFEVPTLSDLSESDNKEWKYYSGDIAYEKTFNMPAIGEGERCVLDLGRVEVVAKVIMNGKEVGTMWKYPYSLDVTKYLNAGSNTVRVVVANTWVNALVGDSYLPDDVEWTTNTLSTAPGVCLEKIPDWVVNHTARPSARKTFISWKWVDIQKWELPASGLIGPVRLMVNN